MLRPLLVVMVLSCALPTLAQTAARKPRTLAGVCGTANWVCVSECIDARCVDRCLREGCEEALKRLEACTKRAGCSPGDTTCSARACGRTCEQAFEPAPPSPEKENANPCEGLGAEQGTKVPEELVGPWELSAATLEPEPRGTPTRLDPDPRSDYARSLHVTPGGCFLMRTKLGEDTLGRGNSLEVRAWGIFSVEKDDTLLLRTRDGQAVGPVCGKPRVMGLSKGKFRGPRYTFKVEEDTLTLTADNPSKQTFQFQRVKEEEKK